MTLLELHYTSAEQGLGGSPGFQFVQLSPGLDPGVCRQVESLLAYEPPRTAPSQPTQAQIADFPVSLSHTLLTGGAAVLCRAAYTGTDYSGRFGNFYAHALYLPGGPGDLGAVLPIDTWESVSWRTQPPVAGISAAPSMEPGGAITRETLLAFTSQRRGQLAAVLTDIMNSFGRHGLQVVLAEDQADGVARWIAVACRSLPRALARRLTFTTYTRRPYQSSQQVIGILPGADFSFTHAELSVQYRVHAAPERSSPPAEPMSWAATAAAIWLDGRPELFDEAYADVFVPDGSPDEAWTDTLTGQLAATALAAGTELPQPATIAAVTWATAHAETQPTRQFWLDLAAGVARSSGQIPASDLGRLCRQADAFQPADVTALLLTAYLSRLPGEIAQDAALDTSTIRWVTERLRRNPYLVQDVGVGDRLQAAFAPELPVSRALLLLEIADVAGIDNLGRAAETMLGPALLADGAAAAEVADFLNSTADRSLRTRVLDFLEDAARKSSGRAAARLVRGAGRAWLLTADLSDFQLLGTAATLASENGPSRVTTFRRAATLLSASGPEDLGYAYGLVWPDQPPSPAEAGELLSGEFALPVWEIPDTAEAFIDLIRHARVIDPEIIRLAERLQMRINPPDPIDRTLLELVTTTGLLRKAVRQPGDAGLAREVPRAMLALLAAWPSPGPPRDAAVDALLTLLVAPGRIEQADTSQQAELHELAVSGDSGLIAAFAERAGQSLAGELTGSPQLHANCFIMWRLEYGRSGDEVWPATRSSLMNDLLAPAARKMDDTSRQMTFGIIEKVMPGLGNEWLQLTQPRGPMTRLPWSRFRSRRTQ
jgi:GTPase-associated protein 1, C-terminal domain/GTPase-associated protein 1, N-terminal domain type 2/GTPase-associated protein 1, middle domain